MGFSVIGIVGVPAQYGGFETLVEQLLPAKGEVIIYCSKQSYENRIKNYKGASLVYLPFRANGPQSIIYDFAAIIHTVLFTRNDMLVLGVSGAIILPFVKLMAGRRRIITNIDGLEWKRQKWGRFAKIFLKMSEKYAVRYSDVVVADNVVIQKYVREEYGVSSTLIPYGGDHATKPYKEASLAEMYPFTENPYALKVCRIEPENNIHIILRAFSEDSRISLAIVGNWSSSTYGANLKKKYENRKNIFLLDPIYDQEKLNQLRAYCHIYVHGHSAGGTNPSLVEAMCLGLPVIAYDVEYNRETTEGQAIYFKDEKELSGILAELDKTDLAEVAMKLRNIGERRYTWREIRREYNLLLSTSNR